MNLSDLDANSRVAVFSEPVTFSSYVDNFLLHWKECFFIFFVILFNFCEQNSIKRFATLVRTYICATILSSVYMVTREERNKIARSSRDLSTRFSPFFRSLSGPKLQRFEIAINTFETAITHPPSPY